MVFGRFRASGPKSKVIETGAAEEIPTDSEVKMHEEDGWAEIKDAKQGQRAGTGATTDEEEAHEADENEEIWDWALEGESSEDSAHQWVLDDFLVSGEPPDPAAEIVELAPTPVVATSDDGKSEAKAEPEESEEKKEPQDSTESSKPEAEAPVEEQGYRCRGCNACIFHGSDIMSSNYQAMTGPGYLIDGTQNTVAATDTQTVVYTTGSYVIREVSCEFCENKLGVTYVVAPDVRNEYKVGKFLLGADRLILPPGVTHPKVK